MRATLWQRAPGTWWFRLWNRLHGREPWDDGYICATPYPTMVLDRETGWMMSQRGYELCIQCGGMYPNHRPGCSYNDADPASTGPTHSRSTDKPIG